MPVAVPTFAELYAAGKTEVMIRDPSLNYWQEGSNLDALVGAMSVVADETMGYALRLHRARFLATAVGEELDALGVDRFGIERITIPSAAVGYVFWEEDAATGYAIPAGTALEGILDDGSVYQAVTTESAVSDSGLPIPVQASVVGRGGNVPARTLVEVGSFLTDPGATVVQRERMAGGAPAEDDNAYRARLQAYLEGLAKGVHAAYMRAVLSVPGIVRTTIQEVAVSAYHRIVQIYVADPEGAGNSSLVAAATLAAEGVRPLGVLVSVVAAAREEIALVVSIELEPTADYLTVLAVVADALLVWTDTLPAGMPIRPSRVAEVCHRAHPAVVSADMVGGTIQPTNPQNSLRLTGGAPTLNLV